MDFNKESLITHYQAKYYAHELSKKSPSHSMEKLASTFVDAQIDLNPHQVDAALFAFSNPLSKGALLADEVGLGKTIEAGLIIAQKWAERKRNILIICPASLRKQWNQELMDKFFIPSIIMEAKSYKEYLSKSKSTLSQPAVLIMSYQFAQSKEEFLVKEIWDLAVIDEAHRIRNVYRTDNKIGKSIKAALYSVPKILLTATPLQNNLQELFGLVSIIDDQIFGDLKSFKAQYAKAESGNDTEALIELRSRLTNVCKRTLRSEVSQHINFTARIPLVETYAPEADEQELYNLMTEYLQKPTLQAIPSSQRHLITMIIRKLLASSSFAISNTIEKLISKLEVDPSENFILDEITEEYEEATDTAEEWTEADIAVVTTDDLFSPVDEQVYLQRALALAKSINKNSKGEKLLIALEKGMLEMDKLGAAKKALIFTESTRTQQYIKEILEKNGYENKIVLFNGSNTDESSKAIYKAWLQKHHNTDRITGSKTADMRAALVEQFKENAAIMIATEAAAEGINLQFCSMIVNYDLPWNPQRIEQRIGRCHRYGQKHDVVVINFLNETNAADVRVFQLLNSKFQLFEGVFGASDDVLGVIESGVDFEKRIAKIYQECRSTDQINRAFNQLQEELEEKISEAKAITRVKVLENFDVDVREKLRISEEQSKVYINKYERWLWDITMHRLKDNANFSAEDYSFQLNKNPYPEKIIHPGPYKIGKNVEDANVYRIGHELAQIIIEECRNENTPPAKLIFDYTNNMDKISILESCVGTKGYLACHNLSVTTFGEEEHILLYAFDEDGDLKDEDWCSRLFNVKVQSTMPANIDQNVINIMQDFKNEEISKITHGINDKNQDFFSLQIDKLDRWTEDKQKSLKENLKDLDKEIKELKKMARLSGNMQDRLSIERKVRDLSNKRDEEWRIYDSEARKLDTQKEELINQVEAMLQNKIKVEDLFLIEWEIV